MEMYFCISASLFPAKKSVTVFDTVAVAVSGNTMASRLIFIYFANNFARAARDCTYTFSVNDNTLTLTGGEGTIGGTYELHRQEE